MILLNVLKAARDRTVSSDKYMWSCFGEHAHTMDFKDADSTVYASAVFDVQSQEVYSINVEVPGYQQAFLWLNPDYKTNYYNECYQRGIDPNIAWDNVNFTHVDTEELILEYVRDVGDTNYDDIPLPPDDIPTLTDTVEQDPPFIMPMPGTMGSATYKFGDGFQNNKETNMFKVNLDVRMTYDVEATSMDEAVSKARKWQQTSKTYHGEGENIHWADSYIVKTSVEQTHEE
jgi:hypothetical protein